MQSIITVGGVSYDFSNGRTLFENLNFTLDSRITALIGPNGIGKTTLAKLIAGELLPSNGSIRRSRAIGFLYQREYSPAISVDEYLSTRYSWSTLGEELLDGIDRTLSCSKLSGGQWMRVRLAATIDDQFLILDEPSNDLDKETKLILVEFLRKYQEGVLLISHDREFLYLCESVLELSNQGLKKYGTGFEAYEKEKELERDRFITELEIAKRERERAKADRIVQIERQDKRTRQGKRAGIKTGMPKILIGARKRRAQATMGRVAVSTLERANEKLKAAAEAYNEMKIDPVMYTDLMGKTIPNQRLLAEAKDFNIRFGENWLYKRDLNFSWRGNIRLAIEGRNGSGKSTLIRALLGEKFESKGKLTFGNLTTLYLDQKCSTLDDSKSVLENVRAFSMMPECDIRNNLAKLLFWGESVFQQVHSLSGGERLRAALACGLLSKETPELIIFDEPTNNLDLPNIKFLETLVSQFQGGVIIISHDEAFIKACGIDEGIAI